MPGLIPNHPPPSPSPPLLSRPSPPLLSPQILQVCPCSDDHDLQPASNSSGTSARIPWPMVWTVPENLFSDEVKKALTSAKTYHELLAKHRHQIIQAHFDAMLRHAVYPNKSRFQEVATAFVAQYPNVKDDAAHCVGCEVWAAAIAEKFRNERRDMKDIEVLIRKKKPRLSLDPETDDSTKKNLFNLTNFLPPLPEGEDEVSISSHRRWMAAELRKVTKDVNTLRNLMDVTFADRRRMIIEQKMLLKDLKVQYPALFNADQLLLEFERLTGRATDATQICRNFGKLVDAVFGAANLAHRKKTDPIKQALLKWKSIKDQTDKNG